MHATLATVKRETQYWRYRIIMSAYLFALALNRLMDHFGLQWRCGADGVEAQV